MQRIVVYFVDRSLLVNIFSVGVLIAGALYLVSAKREAFPSVAFDWVIVSTAYPGATASDVEKHITIAVEDEIREVDGIETVHSSSQEALSTIAIQLDPDLVNKSKVVTNIKNAVDRAKDLPRDSLKPFVLELESGMSPILEVAIHRKKGVHSDADEFALRAQAKILNDRLLTVPGVARIQKKGYRDREMIVEADPKLLDAYQVAINLIVAKLQRQNLNFPGGIVQSKEGDILVRTIGELLTPEDIRRVPVRANVAGNYMTVGTVASVRDSFAEEQTINKSRGQRAIMLTIIKKESADIITLSKKIQVEIGRFRSQIPPDYEIAAYNDISYYVQRRLNVLVNNGIFGFILVVASLYFSLGWRIAFVTALGLPLAMLMTVIWMGQAGVSINMMSMFGLIMVLGMLVDDAIVVSENIYRYIEAGEGVRESVVKGTSEVLLPVAGTVLTTIAAFMPLMFMSGIMGRFVWVLPAVVSVALIASWMECMFILPAHVKDIEERVRHRAGGAHFGSGKLLIRFQNRYRRILEVVLRHRYRFFAGTVVFAVGTVLFGVTFVKFILFPQGGIEVIVITAEAAPGTGVAEMSRKLEDIERTVGGLSPGELDTFSTQAGVKGMSALDPSTIVGTNYGTVVVYLKPAQGRKREADEITEELRQKSRQFANSFVKLEFSPVRSGPPVGKPVNVTIQGEDRDTLRKISAEYRKALSAVKGLKDVKDDDLEGKRELRVFVDERTAEMAGISVYDVATTIRSCYSGTVATTIKKGEEEIDVRVILPEHLRKSTSSLGSIKVANQFGNLVPLARVARVESARGVFALNRKDWRGTISVSADIDEKARGVTSVSVNRSLMSQFSDVERRYPGYVVNYEGEFKDTQESVSELGRSFLIAAMVIYILLVAIFRSLAHPLIIMGVIPFTFLGITWIFFFHSLPLSFIALMGVVGLTGVVVNDSIVLVDFIKRQRAAGVETHEAILLAGVTRLRPVFLTTITTFLGLIPTAYGIGGDDPFLRPMAIALSWGLLFGTLVTLVGTPVLYAAFSDLRARLFGRELV